MRTTKKIIAAALAALLLAACGGQPPRPTIKTNLDALKWGTRSKKKQVIFRAYSRKDPADLIRLLEVTPKEVMQKRVKPDVYWYDNRGEQVWTLRFVINVLAQKLKAKKAVPGILAIGACPFYKDSDGLARFIEKALIKIGSVAQIDAMIKAADAAGVAPSHKGAILQAAAIISKKAGKRTPAALKAALEKMLKSTEKPVLKQGIRLAGTIRYKGAEPLIVAQLSSTDKQIKKAAATALVLLGNVSGVAPLLQMSKSSAVALNQASDLIEKAGFADQVRLWHSKQNAKQFAKQTGYLEKAGAFR